MPKRIVEGDDFSVLPPFIVRLLRRLRGTADHNGPVDCSGSPDAPIKDSGRQLRLPRRLLGLLALYIAIIGTGIVAIVASGAPPWFVIGSAVSLSIWYWVFSLRLIRRSRATTR